jgi:DNA-binding transcriptional regulator YhcF (GntR family)
MHINYITDGEKLRNIGELARIRNLRGSELKIYGYLAELASADGFAFPSYRGIARELGYSVQTIWRGLRTLQEMGFIKKTRRVSAFWGNKSNYYAVNTLPFGKRHSAERVQEVFERPMEEVLVKTNDANIVRLRTDSRQSHNAYYV